MTFFKLRDGSLATIFQGSTSAPTLLHKHLWGDWWVNEWINEWMNEWSELPGTLPLFVAHCYRFCLQPLPCLTYRLLGPIPVIEFLTPSCTWDWPCNTILGCFASSPQRRVAAPALGTGSALSVRQSVFLWQMRSSCPPARKILRGTLCWL